MSSDASPNKLILAYCDSPVISEQRLPPQRSAFRPALPVCGARPMLPEVVVIHQRL